MKLFLLRVMTDRELLAEMSSFLILMVIWIVLSTRWWIESKKEGYGFGFDIILGAVVVLPYGSFLMWITYDTHEFVLKIIQSNQ